jgi:hypothetical protein
MAARVDYREFDRSSLWNRFTASADNYVRNNPDGRVKLVGLTSVVIAILAQCGQVSDEVVQFGRLAGRAKDLLSLPEAAVHKRFDIRGISLAPEFWAKASDWAKAFFSAGSFLISMGILRDPAIPVLGAVSFVCKIGSNASGAIFSIIRGGQDAMWIGENFDLDSFTAERMMSCVRSVVFLALSALSLAVALQYVEATQTIVLAQNLLNLTGTALTIFLVLFNQAVVDPAVRRI